MVNTKNGPNGVSVRDLVKNMENLVINIVTVNVWIETVNSRMFQSAGNFMEKDQWNMPPVMISPVPSHAKLNLPMNQKSFSKLTVVLVATTPV